MHHAVSYAYMNSIHAQPPSRIRMKDLYTTRSRSETQGCELLRISRSLGKLDWDADICSLGPTLVTRALCERSILPDSVNGTLLDTAPQSCGDFTNDRGGFIHSIGRTHSEGGPFAIEVSINYDGI